MKIVKIFIVVLFIFPGLIGEEKIEHRSEVKARILPLCVVDSNGSPVLDLKQRDIELKVGGVEVQFQLLKYNFGETNTFTDKGKTGKPVGQERVVFLIFDAMYNSKLGLLRAKDIATKYVNRAGSGNNYVVMSITGNEGLKYIYGPSRNKRSLGNVINNLDIVPEFYGPNLFSLIGKDAAAEGIMQNDPAVLNMMMIQNKFREQRYYINNIKSFSGKLGRLRYILKTLDVPKTVFLLSEGIARGAFNKRGKGLEGNKKNTALFNLLKSTVRSISSTGAMFYTINPQIMDPENERTSIYDSGDRSLQLLALEGGGEYFSGAETSKIVENISKASTAYYELAFNVSETGSRKVKVKGLREGLKITTLRGIEKRSTYEDMDETEKRIYAINMNFNRMWMASRGKAEAAVCRYIKTLEKDGVAYNRLEVKIPENLRKSSADIFIINLKNSGSEHKITKFNKKLDEKEFIEVPVNEDGKSFFVLVVRKTGYGVYGDGSWSSKSWNSRSEDFSFTHSPVIMKTVGGVVDICGNGEEQFVRLNGKVIHSSLLSMKFIKIYKAGLEDALLLDCSGTYRVLMFKADGGYGISEKYALKPVKFSDNGGSIFINGKAVNLIGKGKVDGNLKSFWLFYTKFRKDKEYQKKRVVFPSVRRKYDSEGKLTGTVEVSEKEWVFTNFENSPPYLWEGPVVKGDTAYVTLKGEGVNVRVIFEKIKEKWFLIGSDSF